MDGGFAVRASHEDTTQTTKHHEFVLQENKPFSRRVVSYFARCVAGSDSGRMKFLQDVAAGPETFRSVGASHDEHDSNQAQPQGFGTRSVALIIALPLSP